MPQFDDSIEHGGKLTLRPDENGDVFIAGVDEAGLGPMLGPLCVGAALMSVPVSILRTLSSGSDVSPVDAAFCDLWKALTPHVSREPRPKSLAIPVCDSKLLHSPSKGIKPLEDSVLPLLGLVHPELLNGFNWSDFWKHVAFAPERVRVAHPWYAEADVAFPLESSADRIRLRSALARKAFAATGIRLHSLSALAVVESEFNRMVDEHANKSDVDLAAFAHNILSIWKRCPSVIVACDRLGGRQFYADSLAAHLKPDRLTIVEETETQASYVLDRAFGGRMHSMLISFSVRGDQKCFPVALASMVAKYTREVCMEAFNRFWCGQQPGLKPTKGYVTDARRWLQDTRALREAMDLPEDMLIRKL